eukprot:CAMPEP_0114252668 /NCGR_PEP_ID=MMETSP0058-20121206/15962_1 /TAXON_ID=36894 /ORGANISM="Pyramimonas parkeae, CCMP726" /LENGTH=184 /DNA_ID=CAMNT_0001366623 /DNA_START=298 /DNA_END=852 /DNA_ORIENTATION=-
MTTQNKMHWWEGAGGMQEYLRDEKKLKVLPPAEVVELMEAGQMVLLDVREPEDFEDVHAVGAQHVPLYNQLQGISLKRLVYAVNGMTGSELNPKFLEEVQAKIPNKDAAIAVMCNSGGTVEASSTAGLEGKKSRSLMSIYMMMKDGGYTNVVHVDGGMREWGAKGLPNEGKDPEAWAKKASMMP